METKEITNKGKIDSEEINKIWKNTKTYETADSEIAVLFDLYEGLKKSGYKYFKAGETAEQLATPFVVVDLKELNSTLEKICCYTNGPFVQIDLPKEYCEKLKIGLHPSSVLTSQGLLKNPKLLTVLLGELDSYKYYIGSIYAEDKNIFAGYNYSLDSIFHPEKLDTGKESAINLSKNLAKKLVMLNSKSSHKDSAKYYEYEKNLGGKLDLSFEEPYVFVKDIKLYEMNAFDITNKKLEDLQQKYASFEGNEHIQGQIDIAIDKIEKIINTGNSDYVSSFKITK